MSIDIGSDKCENLRNLVLYFTSKLTSSVYLKKIMAPALNGVMILQRIYNFRPT